MNDKEFLVKLLRDKGACNSSMEWTRGLPDGTTLEEAWNACPWVEWLGWLLTNLHRYEGVPLETLVLVSCALVRAMYKGNPDVEVPDDAERVLSYSASWAKGEGASLTHVKDAVRALEVWMRVMTPVRRAGACAAAARSVGWLVGVAGQDDYGLSSFEDIYRGAACNAVPTGLPHRDWRGWQAWNKTLCAAVRDVVPWSAVWAGVQKAGWEPKANEEDEENDER